MKSFTRWIVIGFLLLLIVDQMSFDITISKRKFGTIEAIYSVVGFAKTTWKAFL